MTNDEKFLRYIADSAQVDELKTKVKNVSARLDELDAEIDKVEALEKKSGTKLTETLNGLCEHASKLRAKLLALKLELNTVERRVLLVDLEIETRG